jgi:membrane protein YdbS with pleckstrin-like domain
MTLLKMLRGEDGHAGPVPAALLAAAGAIVLGVGAANGTGWLAVVGGVVLALGILATLVLNHVTVEYDMYARLEVLEKRDRGAPLP